MPNTLLLADDSVTIQKVVGITFANEDIELVTVDNGEEALARCREIRPNMVLADVTMPGLSGYDLCREIKQDPALSRIPVLLLAGTFETFNEELATSVGADGHVTKPFEAQVLIDRVNDLLSRAPVAPPPLPAAEPVQEAPLPLPTEAMDAPAPAPLEAPFPEPEEPPVGPPPGPSESPWSPESEISPQELVAPVEEPAPEGPPADPFLGATTGGHGPQSYKTEPDEGRTALFDPGAELSGPISSGSMSPMGASQKLSDSSGATPPVELESSPADENEDWADALMRQTAAPALPGADAADALFDGDALAAGPSPEPPMIDAPVAEPTPEPSVADDLDDASLLGKTLPPDALTLIEDPPHETQVAAAIPIDPEVLRQSLEKVAWEAFGSISEMIVKDVVAKVEAIAWEVVPSLAERLIAEEIKRLKRDPPAE